MPQAKFGKVLRHIHVMVDSVAQKERTDRQCLESFLVKSDEASFSTLLLRHGPMVFRVCRRVLHHEHDAEDAFQATFLVLARNSGSIRNGDALADWLYGVAYRTAMKAKRTEARRRTRENRLEPTASTVPKPVLTMWTYDEESNDSVPAACVSCVLKAIPPAPVNLELRNSLEPRRLPSAPVIVRRRGIELGGSWPLWQLPRGRIGDVGNEAQRPNAV